VKKLRFLINYSYDGSNYNGYQKQKGLNTIQGKIEEALKYINNGKDTKFSSSGRTDAGVHAINQYGHADIDVNITEYKLMRALNSLLPDDIYIKSAKLVDSNFHSRYNVLKKEYIYKINMGMFNPIERQYVYQLCKKLNVKKMNEAAKYLIGNHDFKNFSSNEHKEKDTVRTIYDIKIIEKGDYLSLSFTSNGFLKYMVRIMVGILIQIGLEKFEPEYINDIFNMNCKSNYKKIAPAQGLYLFDVTY